MWHYAKMNASNEAPAFWQGLNIILYVRRDCHLCEEAEAMLARLSEELGFAWQPVPIEGEADLELRYGESIPVLAIDGTPRLFAPFTLQQARQLLQDLIRRSRQ
jgi:hypothetical protein